MGMDMFDREGKAITAERWGELHAQGVEPDGRYGPQSYVRVGEDVVDGVTVSTVWMGIDHGFADGRPVIFESMIFGGDHDQEQMRYCTEEEAIKGHAEAVHDLRAGMPPWWAYGGQDE